jgi:hypothetical protein
MMNMMTSTQSIVINQEKLDPQKPHQRIALFNPDGTPYTPSSGEEETPGEGDGSTPMSGGIRAHFDYRKMTPGPMIAQGSNGNGRLDPANQMSPGNAVSAVVVDTSLFDDRQMPCKVVDDDGRLSFRTRQEDFETEEPNDTRAASAWTYVPGGFAEDNSPVSSSLDTCRLTVGVGRLIGSGVLSDPGAVSFRINWGNFGVDKAYLNVSAFSHTSAVSWELVEQVDGETVHSSVGIINVTDDNPFPIAGDWGLIIREEGIIVPFHNGLPLQEPPFELEVLNPFSAIQVGMSTATTDPAQSLAIPIETFTLSDWACPAWAATAA